MQLFFGSRIFCFQGIAGFYFLGLMFKSTDVTLLRLLLGSLSFSCALEFLKIITGLEVISFFGFEILKLAKSHKTPVVSKQGLRRLYHFGAWS